MPWAEKKCTVLEVQELFGRVNNSNKCKSLGAHISFLVLELSLLSSHLSPKYRMNVNGINHQQMQFEFAASWLLIPKLMLIVTFFFFCMFESVLFLIISECPFLKKKSDCSAFNIQRIRYIAESIAYASNFTLYYFFIIK